MEELEGKNPDEVLDKETGGQAPKEDLLPEDTNKGDLLPKDAGRETESELEHDVEEAAEELDIHLPHVILPLPIKFIALITLVGGLSILGSTFVDIFTPGDVGFLLYIWRLVVGLLAIFISYGLVRKERWAVWIYGILVVIALLGNFFVALLPAAMVFYLWLERRYFRPSLFDALAVKLIGFLKRS